MVKTNGDSPPLLPTLLHGLALTYRGGFTFAFLRFHGKGTMSTETKTTVDVKVY
jgi:hypothetical protein